MKAAASARVPTRGRRHLLGALGAAGVAAFAWRSSARQVALLSGSHACVPTPEQTEGPYFVDEHLNRSDLRSDPSTGAIKEGVPLALEIRVASIDGSGCRPLAGATVDLWHCDAQGTYSDTKDWRYSSIGSRYLRGFQVTDASGVVRFNTIYPGWYRDRAVHLHVKVRADRDSARGPEFTSQFYFADSITDRVLDHPAYRQRAGRRARNEEDRLFREGGGARLLLALTEAGPGYGARFDLGLVTRSSA